MSHRTNFLRGARTSVTWRRDYEADILSRGMRGTTTLGPARTRRGSGGEMSIMSMLRSSSHCRSSFYSSVTALCLLVLPTLGCDDPDAGAGASAGAEGDASTGQTSQTEDGGADAGASTAGEEAGGDETGTTGDPEGKDDGQTCMADAECKSGHCFDTGEGMVCSQCGTDQDCRDGGSGLNCNWDRDLGYRVCEDGSLGQGCDDEQGCQSDHCTKRSEESRRGTCSECGTDEDCRESGAGLSCGFDREQGFYACSAGALGDRCEDDAGCQEGKCHAVGGGPGGGGGVCSLCLDDMECRDAGTGLNCTRNDPADDSPRYYECSDGALGERCESNESCAEMKCRMRSADSTSGTCSKCLDDQGCRDDGTGLNCVFKPSEVEDDPEYYDCSDGALGERCEANESCADAKCHLDSADATRGTCSACLDAAECRASGDGTNCSFLDSQDPEDSQYWACSEGALGERCIAAEDCADASPCVELLDGLSTCSECAVDGDCGSGQLCHMLFNFGGGGDNASYHTCVDEGSVANDELCRADTSGESACEGHCVAIDPDAADGDFPPAHFGACGSCRPDVADDCAAGETCRPPRFGQGGVRGSTCE